jgi:hypothetical protein
MPTNLHTALQQHYAGASGRIEASVAGYRVDVLRDGAAYEIQTGSFHKLREKLKAISRHAPVVVVYPVVEAKTIVRVDMDTGEVLSSRRSPKRGKLTDCFPELRHIAPVLASENVSLHIVRTVEREVRPPVGTRRRRRGEEVVDRELVEIAQTLELSRPEDWLAFLPPNLPQRFTVGDLGQATGISRWHAGHMSYVLRSVGAIRQVDKHGNAFVYEAVRTEPGKPSKRERGWVEVRCAQCNLLACEAKRRSHVRWRCAGCGSLETWPASP